MSRNARTENVLVGVHPLGVFRRNEGSLRTKVLELFEESAYLRLADCLRKTDGLVLAIIHDKAGVGVDLKRLLVPEVRHARLSCEQQVDVKEMRERTTFFPTFPFSSKRPISISTA